MERGPRSDFSELVDREIAIAQAEFARRERRAGIGGASGVRMSTVVAVFAFYAYASLTMFLVMVFESITFGALAALIVAATCVAVTGVVTADPVRARHK